MREHNRRDSVVTEDEIGIVVASLHAVGVSLAHVSHLGYHSVELRAYRVIRGRNIAALERLCLAPPRGGVEVISILYIGWEQVPRDSILLVGQVYPLP